MNYLKKSCLLSAALIAWTGSPSFAAGSEQPNSFHPYIGIIGGLDFLPAISGTDQFFTGGPGTLNTKVGDFAGAVIGVQFNESWRFEAEVSRSYNGINNFTFNNGNVNTYPGGAVNQTYALGNVWYGFRNKSAFVPYLGGGVGVGWADGNLDMGSGHFVSVTAPAALAFQIGAGVTYNVSERFSIDAGYRFKAMTGLNPTVTTNWGGPDRLDQNSIGSHNFQIGATLRF
jgi:opacity protein-like surface antigen